MLAEERHQVSVLACDQGSNENKPCKTEHIYVEDRMIQLLIQNYIEYSNRKFHLAKSTEHGASTQPILVILRNLISMTMAMEVII